MLRSRRMVSELAADQVGQLKVKRFSDLDNTAGRNGAFADTVEGQLRRLSGEALEYQKFSLDRVRNSKAELDQVLRNTAFSLKPANR